MKTEEILNKLKSFKRKWRREYNRECKFQQSLYETTLDGKQKLRFGADLSLEKSVGIQIGYGFCLSEIEKLIKEIEVVHVGNQKR
jgi:hypothetical protein